MSADWVTSSGATFERGTVIRYRATEAEIRSLDLSTQAERLAAAELRRACRRSPDRESRLQGLCEWLGSYSLDLIGTVSFTDQYAASRGIYSITRALEDVRAGLNEVPMKQGRRVGFPFRYVLCGEWHPSGRTVPHVHLALESGGEPQEKISEELWRYFFTTRGRSRFEPMRDQNKATLYGLKDTVKGAEDHGDWIVARLTHARTGRSRRRH